MGGILHVKSLFDAGCDPAAVAINLARLFKVISPANRTPALRPDTVCGDVGCSGSSAEERGSTATYKN